MIYAKEQPAIAKAILGDQQYAALAEKAGVPGGGGHQLYEKYRKLPPGDPLRDQLAQESRAYYQRVRTGGTGQ